MKPKILAGLITLLVSNTSFADGDFTSTVNQIEGNRDSVVTINQANDDDFISVAVSTAEVEQSAGTSAVATISQLNTSGSNASIVQSNISRESVAIINQEGNDHHARVVQFSAAIAIVDQTGESNQIHTHSRQGNVSPIPVDELSLTQSGSDNDIHAGHTENTSDNSLILDQGGENNYIYAHQEFSGDTVMTVSQIGKNNEARPLQEYASASGMEINIDGDNNYVRPFQRHSTNDQLSISLTGSSNTVETRQGESGNPSSNNAIDYTAIGNANNAAIYQYGSNHSYIANQSGDNGNVNVCQGSSVACSDRI